MITKIFKRNHRTGAATVFAFFLTAVMSCSVQLPEDFKQTEELPKIYPDYVEVTVPINIAPLTFEMGGQWDEMAVRYSFGDEEIICRGDKARPDIDDWKSLTAAAKGKAIEVDTYARKDGQWTRFKTFNIFVSADSIDAYISYRLIHPSYVSYEELTINQRSLENYDENVIYDNILCTEDDKGQCINCHNYQQYNPERMQFHARQNHGGTAIAYDGKIRKINMRNDSILSAGVYPTWHPELPLIVYSTNMTRQNFHVTDANKVEVYDTESDLIAYDVEKNEVTNIENARDELEVFPFWAPDGKYVYYCSAHFEYPDSVTNKDIYLLRHSNKIWYNIYRKPFNAATMEFGPRELVFAADTLGMSATLPRISPDGRYLMFTMAKYGVFHIWHRDADLWMIDLSTGQAQPAEELNSPDTESYHSWSSNGRWVVFSSRRDDGVYTRPFIAHIDENGKGTKPFELPCADPDYHRQLMKSYNVPEFMRGPVTIRPQDFADVFKRDEGEAVKYVSRLRR
jgi:hypothetical protein